MVAFFFFRMYRKNAEGEIPLHSAIKCAVATLTDKIISSENDLVGVCFYGTVIIQFHTWRVVEFLNTSPRFFRKKKRI